jgi:hypothetical protein
MRVHSTQRASRRGMAIVYSLFAMTAFIAVSSLAVDYGRVQLVKSELQAAADAAARAGAAGIDSGNAVADAIWCAAQNHADGSPVTLATTGSDVQVGHWDEAAGQFIDGGYPRDAVRVIAVRSAERGNAVQLAFASLLGRKSMDLSVKSVARKISAQPTGIVGIDSISMSGSSSDSYWSPTGECGGNNGLIASNGDIKLLGSSDLLGNARPGPSHRVLVSGAAHVTGSTTPATELMSFPNGDAGRYNFDHNNAMVPSFAMQSGSLVLGDNQRITLPGGHYYFNNITLSGTASVSFTGPAVVYCYGNVTMTGNVSTQNVQPRNLKLVMVPGPTGNAPGSVTLNGNAALYAIIYAPQSPLTIWGSGDLYGSVIAKSLTTGGSAKIHYDLSLGNGRTIETVQ